MLTLFPDTSHNYIQEYQFFFLSCDTWDLLYILYFVNPGLELVGPMCEWITDLFFGRSRFIFHRLVHAQKIMVTHSLQPADREDIEELSSKIEGIDQLWPILTRCVPLYHKSALFVRMQILNLASILAAAYL
jgi:hypothetical protein